HVESASQQVRPLCDSDLLSINGLSHLKCLRICAEPDTGQITDAGVRHLAGLKNLEILDLNNQPITDESIAVLSRLKTIEFLDLSGTNLTNAGLAKLRTKLPRTRIFSNGGEFQSPH
ncbi:MAG TPA: hypothetical protein VGJ04_07605, partial [Pirellulales bacterium]